MAACPVPPCLSIIGTAGQGQNVSRFIIKNGSTCGSRF